MKDDSTRGQRLQKLSRERRASEREDLQRTILDAAASVFLEHGYEGFSMRRVAEQIGYSATTLYRYYDSKDHLLYAIVQEGFRRFGAQLKQAAAKKSKPVDQLKAVCAAYVKFGLDVQEAALRANPKLDSTGFGEDPRDAWGLLGSGDESRAIPTEVGGYQRFYEGVVNALRNDGPPPVDPRDSVAALEVIEAAQISAAERRVVAVERRAGLAGQRPGEESSRI